MHWQIKAFTDENLLNTASCPSILPICLCLLTRLVTGGQPRWLKSALMMALQAGVRRSVEGWKHLKLPPPPSNIRLRLDHGQKSA